MKDTRVEVLKRKSTNSVLSFDDVLNDINDWLAEENGENDEIGDNFDGLCGEEEEEIDSTPSEEWLEEEQQSEEPEDNVSRQQRYRPKKQLTRNRNVLKIDSSLDENNYKSYIWTKMLFWKNFVVILVQRKKKTQRKFGGAQNVQ